MGNMKYLYDLLRGCPDIALTADGVHIDELEYDCINFSLESLPSDPVIRRYFGGSLRRLPFALTARRPFFTDAERTANLALYERVSAWMDELTARHALPPMGNGKTPKRLQATGCTYVSDQGTDGETALYLMQGQLIYFQKG